MKVTVIASVFLGFSLIGCGSPMALQTKSATSSSATVRSGNASFIEDRGSWHMVKDGVFRALYVETASAGTVTVTPWAPTEEVSRLQAAVIAPFSSELCPFTYDKGDVLVSRVNEYEDGHRTVMTNTFDDGTKGAVVVFTNGTEGSVTCGRWEERYHFSMMDEILRIADEVNRGPEGRSKNP